MILTGKLNPTAVNLLKMSRERYRRNLANAFADHNQLLENFTRNSAEINELLKDIHTIDKELEALGG